MRREQEIPALVVAPQDRGSQAQVLVRACNPLILELGEHLLAELDAVPQVPGLVICGDEAGRDQGRLGRPSGLPRLLEQRLEHGDGQIEMPQGLVSLGQGKQRLGMVPRRDGRQVQG
ncbi:hypothetical protein N869_02545 [Cellulomonas bogoriensis 69B4 = DSM 16987]|uniref:Uncharacterized protein n=1 Tax=Cellulomonas bogoriensis 69B4 = DSM 16987 TaxID=1386082 RepID=A0A0A0BVL5_9CELL|nr:hypothetical protein N869_02545 [Cellulomonas bogoriensis 69B4 = DSM 16987]